MTDSTTDPSWSNATWRKSSRSGGSGNCVEVAFLNKRVAFRDSKDPTGPILVFTNEEWRSFIAWVREGAPEHSP
ncbi:DUF397 domain-containing protein [Paractinoplanes rhizophilus]|uniref:DUF397 domain-containing protein n=1 Tax=Paractinoplanes rhizophilus TaxID=1416877 RepID=A0ABW2I1N1_9ACTN